MNQSPAEHPPQDLTIRNETRARILDAAKTRMMHYGFAKTTMAEIAADCLMSPGNLYRFFESKQEIVEALAVEHHAEEYAHFCQIANDVSMPPDERLRALLFDMLDRSYMLLEEKPRLFDIVEFLSRERISFMNARLAQERIPLAQIIRDGMAAGLFVLTDPDLASETLQCATMKYRYPQLSSRLDLTQLRRELGLVCQLLINGMKHSGGGMFPHLLLAQAQADSLASRAESEASACCDAASI